MNAAICSQLLLQPWKWFTKFFHRIYNLSCDSKHRSSFIKTVKIDILKFIRR